MVRDSAAPGTGQRTTVGRYELVHQLASGGMGMVYLGRMRAARGVSMPVAIKRINPAFAGDARIMTMFVDEARITSTIRHPNVVPTLDVVEEGGELLLVMEYVHGVSLARLLAAARARDERLPLAVVARLASDVLHGLHAAHEARDAEGRPLEIVHRDVSPQNVLVGVDGVARVADFGIARAAIRMESTRVGEVKGKLRYIAPEQFEREAIDRRADVYGVGLLLWEMIVGRAMRRASAPGGLARAILEPKVDPPSSHVPDLPAALDDVVIRALANEPRDRYAFADQMAVALEGAVVPAPYAKVAELVRELGEEDLSERRLLLDRPSASSVQEIGVPPTATTVDAPLPAPSLPARSRRRAALFGAAALATLLLVVVLVRPRRASVEPPPAEPSPPPVAAAPPSPPSRPPTAATETATTAAPLAAVAPPAAPSRKPAPFVPRRHRRPPSSPKVDCSIPYVVDAKGIRVPRPECM